MGLKAKLTTLMLGALLLGGCQEAGSSDSNNSTGTSPGASVALETLETLEVKGRGPKTGYERAMFGDGWLDLDKNGCQTRDEILQRDMIEFYSEDGCKVLTGVLLDPYSGKNINFVRTGQMGPDGKKGDSSAVQIDHVVALSDAWQKNAPRWDQAKREQFANDPLNLLAVDGPLNSQKSDSDAASWLPPNKDFRCTYVSLQVQVKAKYAVAVTSAEKDAMKRVLNTCSDDPANAQTTPRDLESPIEETIEPVPEVTLETESSETTPGGTLYDPRFSTCAEAKAEGYGPYLESSQEYSWYQDGDGDGTACE